MDKELQGIKKLIRGIISNVEDLRFIRFHDGVSASAEDDIMDICDCIDEGIMKLWDALELNDIDDEEEE